MIMGFSFKRFYDINLYSQCNIVVLIVGLVLVQTRAMIHIYSKIDT